MHGSTHRFDQTNSYTIAAALSFAAVLLSVATPLSAETRYVTDILRLELTTEPGNGSEALQFLTSGAELEILESQRYYARVQTTDGQTGWVKSGYLTDEKPAQARLQELERQRDALATQVGSLQSNLSAQADALSEAQTGLQAAQATSARSKAELAALREQHDALSLRAERLRYSVPLSWLLGITLATLVGGFIAGLAWLDWRHRMRHGGFRI